MTDFSVESGRGRLTRFPGEQLPTPPRGFRWAPSTRPHLDDWQAYDEDDRPVPTGACPLSEYQPFGSRHVHRSPAECYTGKPASFDLVRKPSVFARLFGGGK